MRITDSMPLNPLNQVRSEIDTELVNSLRIDDPILRAIISDVAIENYYRPILESGIDTPYDFKLGETTKCLQATLDITRIQNMLQNIRSEDLQSLLGEINRGWARALPSQTIDLLNNLARASRWQNYLVYTRHEHPDVIGNDRILAIGGMSVNGVFQTRDTLFACTGGSHLSMFIDPDVRNRIEDDGYRFAGNYQEDSMTFSSPFSQLVQRLAFNLYYHYEDHAEALIIADCLRRISRMDISQIKELEFYIHSDRIPCKSCQSILLVFNRILADHFGIESRIHVTYSSDNVGVHIPGNFGTDTFLDNFMHEVGNLRDDSGNRYNIDTVLLRNEIQTYILNPTRDSNIAYLTSLALFVNLL